MYNVHVPSGIGTGLFGNKAQTGFATTFNQPQSSATGSLFGSTTTNTGGSLFGGTATGSIFGQQPTTQCKCSVLANSNPFHSSSNTGKPQCGAKELGEMCVLQSGLLISSNLFEMFKCCLKLSMHFHVHVGSPSYM